MTADTVFCTQCGATNPAAARFCDQCGTPLVKPAPPASPPVAAAAPVVAPAAAAAPLAAAVPASAEIICTQCGIPALAGEAFCDNCGTPLPLPAAMPQPAYPAPQPVGGAVAPAPAPPVAVQPQPASPPVAVPAPALRATLAPAALEVEGSGQRVPLPAAPQALVGRADPASSHYPEIDLGPFGGLEQGVGRRHLRLFVESGQLMAEDLDSVNGTAINGQRLARRTPVPLRPGDRLVVGRMVLRLVE